MSDPLETCLLEKEGAPLPTLSMGWVDCVWGLMYLKRLEIDVVRWLLSQPPPGWN